LRFLFLFPAIFVCASVHSFAGGPKICVTADEASKRPNKDVCIATHVYEIVQLADGTRFLDVCPPDLPDDGCHFTIISLPEDRREVGELNRYRNADVHIRGMVQPLPGRFGMLLSHSRQFYGGPPKFKPNPKLLRGFDAEQDHRPVSDPNLRRQGGRRAFMDQLDRTTRPTQ